MRLLTESSGTQAGYLLLPRGGEWVVECAQTAEGGVVSMLESLPIGQAWPHELGLSEAIVNYVANAGDGAPRRRMSIGAEHE